MLRLFGLLWLMDRVPPVRWLVKASAFAVVVLFGLVVVSGLVAALR